MSGSARFDSSRRAIACVIGTRPEVVKMAPIVAALSRSPHFRPILVNTGQHRDLLEEAMELFGLVPDVSLDLMQPGQRLAAFFGRCVQALDGTFEAQHPAAVMAQGDTSTVLAASLVCFYQRLPFFHVEAGLRTRDFANPFPEEMNRTLAAHFASLHFAPTAAARDNLLAERVPEASVEVTGNTVIDALLMARERRVPHGIPRTAGTRLIVVTAHRRENFGAPLRAVLRALVTIARRHPDVEIVYPAHPNPEVRRAIADEIGTDDSVRVVDPIGYGPFVTLLDEATLILTDSGGIQEEAPALGKPVLVLREETERPEAIAFGVAKLVGTDTDRIVNETSRLLDDPAHYRTMAKGASPYGDGHAASRIVSRIERHFGVHAAQQAVPG